MLSYFTKEFISSYFWCFLVSVLTLIIWTVVPPTKLFPTLPVITNVICNQLLHFMLYASVSQPTGRGRFQTGRGKFQVDFDLLDLVFSALNSLFHSN